jgi:hypothetical protein
MSSRTQGCCPRSRRRGRGNGRGTLKRRGGPRIGRTRLRVGALESYGVKKSQSWTYSSGSSGTGSSARRWSSPAHRVSRAACCRRSQRGCIRHSRMAVAQGAVGLVEPHEPWRRGCNVHTRGTPRAQKAVP